MQNHSKPLHNYLEYASLGIRMIGIMGISIWIGLTLDKYFELRFPAFLSLFSVGSTVLSIYMTIRKLLYQLNNPQGKSKHKKRNDN
ncbi:MAG: hypothetical protein BGO68_03470 [Candidatus Amoebophilus sp. 36-38]|nr:MAG: hypothetical protein BGO68_03470 [Candidatus Amoebophilus sp. 36-38]